MNGLAASDIHKARLGAFGLFYIFDVRHVYIRIPGILHLGKMNGKLTCVQQ
jgi:hypothetical protein